MTRPDHVNCALTGIAGDKTTWCGRKNVHEWTFVDAGHAALNARNEGSLVLCPDCAKAIIAALRGHHA